MNIWLILILYSLSGGVRFREFMWNFFEDILICPNPELMTIARPAIYVLNNYLKLILLLLSIQYNVSIIDRFGAVYGQPDCTSTRCTLLRRRSRRRPGTHSHSIRSNRRCNHYGCSSPPPASSTLPLCE